MSSAFLSWVLIMGFEDLGFLKYFASEHGVTSNKK
jgi:hypothetical protein